jgi:hypothetical protein
MSRFVVASATLVFCLAPGVSHVPAAAAQDLEAIRATKRLTAVRIAGPITVDGVMNEPEWERADPARDFIQQYPDELKPATRRTEVRVLYDDAQLYIGAMMYEDDPGALITNDLKRDFSSLDSDSLGIALDTFRDRQNAYGFQINPGGAMRDTLATENGRANDPNWDAVWLARTAILPNGWSLEMVLPFKTLRFPEQPSQDWGLNFVRTSRRINERSTWAPVPRQFSHYNPVFAGTLMGIAAVEPGRNLSVKPFATSRVGRGVAGSASWTRESDGGIDLKWSITSSLTLDGTYRTDFSQVEADEQQINLTRFSLFFPEKRQFFLEAPATFQIGLQVGARRDLIPFFSRNIGLVAGQPVPVVGGARLTGRAGRQTIGALNMQTESFSGRPGDNFSALVVKRALSSTTTVGGFYFGREARGTASFNRVGGFDFRYKPTRTLDVEGFLMRSGTSGQPGDWAGRTGFLLDSSRHEARLGLLHIGDSFRHDLGFVRRRGIGTLFGSYTRIFQPADRTRRVLQHDLGVSYETTSNDQYDRQLTEIGGVSYSMHFADGGQFGASVSSTLENLDAPFGIGPVLSVQPGKYRYEDAGVTYSSNSSAPVSGRVEVRAGEFWTGRQKEFGGSVRVRVNAHLAASATFGRSMVTLPEGSFTGDLVGLRVDTSFTPRMFLNAFIQYNGETDAWLSNVRFNLIHRPLSDIYIVWNETRQPAQDQRALLLKYTQLIAF